MPFFVEPVGERRFNVGQKLLALAAPRPPPRSAPARRQMDRHSGRPGLRARRALCPCPAGAQAAHRCPAFLARSPAGVPACRCSSVRMLCSRSASLMITTRTSLTMASSILRTFSAWRSSRLANWILSILVTPSTMCATCSPKRAEISSVVTGVSSTASCSRPAAMAVESSFISASTCATSSGCSTYGSPEARSCAYGAPGR